ncbi:MAG: hypothetical protein RJA07_2829 [Bacteroidota bacterium]|jgi:uncharacterized RDD family membrane protein YckC
MNELIIDDNIEFDSVAKPVYNFATNTSRFFAMLIDNILVVLSIFIAIFILLKFTSNYIEVAEIFVYVIVLHKPFCEYLFGYTIGKKMVGIKILNTDFEKCTFKNIVSRNILLLIFITIQLALTCLRYYLQSRTLASNISFVYDASYFILNTMGVLIFIDSISIWFKQDGVMIHDTIGKTYVVEDKK